MDTSSQNSFYRISGFFRPYKIKVFFAALALFVTAASILLYGHIAKIFIDQGVSLDDNSQIDSFFTSFVVLTVLLAISGYVRSYLINNISLNIINDLRKKIFTNSLRFPAVYFDNNGYGDILSCINSDVNELFNAFTKNVTFFLRNAILFCGGFIFLWIASFKLFLIMLAAILIAFVPIFLLAKKMRISSKNTKELTSKAYCFMEESFSFIKIIKSLGAEGKSGVGFIEMSDRLLNQERAKIKLQSAIVSISIFFAFFAVALILYFGALDVVSGKITAGDLSAFIFYAVILSIALVGLTQSIMQILSIGQSAKRIFLLLDEECEDFSVGDEVGVRKDSGSENIIEFRDVSFSYARSSEQKVLDGFNLKIKKGIKLLIRGDSGCGKSSIFSLLLHFYDVSSGDIFINNRSIKDYKLSALRGLFSYVMQDSFIFSGSLFDNIAYHNNKISKSQVSAIVASCQAFDFIKDLPEGLDSDVGNIGAKLSGGQKQRISILRSILNDSQILIFDEAVSALDANNEKLMIDLIKQHAKNKTLIFVSHKSNVGIEFDEIIDLRPF